MNSRDVIAEVKTAMLHMIFFMGVALIVLPTFVRANSQAVAMVLCFAMVMRVVLRVGYSAVASRVKQAKVVVSF